MAMLKLPKSTSKVEAKEQTPTGYAPEPKSKGYSPLGGNLYPEQHGVPIPPVSRIHHTKYGFNLMSVNGYKFIPGKNSSEIHGTLTSVKKMGMRFTVRQMQGIDPATGKKVDGTGVWRTA